MGSFKIRFDLEPLSGDLKKMTNRFCRKQIARNRETGFPILNKEECRLSGGLIAAVAAGAVFTTIVAAWRQQRGKRK